MPFSYGARELEYGLQRPSFFNASTAALGAGDSDNTVLNIPFDEIWELHSAGMFLSTGAVVTQTGKLFVNQVNGIAVPIGPLITLLGLQQECLSRIIIAPPGSQLLVQVVNAVATNVVTVRMLAYKFPRTFFGRASL